MGTVHLPCVNGHSEPGSLRSGDRPGVPLGGKTRLDTGEVDAHNPSTGRDRNVDRGIGHLLGLVSHQTHDQAGVESRCCRRSIEACTDRVDHLRRSHATEGVQQRRESQLGVDDPISGKVFDRFGRNPMKRRRGLQSCVDQIEAGEGLGDRHARPDRHPRCQLVGGIGRGRNTRRVTQVEHGRRANTPVEMIVDDDEWAVRHLVDRP